MRYLFIVFMLGLLSMSGFNVAASDGQQKYIPIENLEDTLRIVAFGNSITAVRKTIKAVFAERLPALLEGEGISAKIINSGIGGSHTGRRIDHDLFKIRHARDRFQTDVLDHNPDLTIVGFGTNDSYIDEKVKGGQSRIPLNNYRENLRFIIQELQKNGSEIILIAPNCLGGDYPEFQNKRLLKYVRVVQKFARKYKTGLFDNFKMFRQYDKVEGQSMDELMLDGVHPNDKGHELMAENLIKEIIKIDERKARDQ